MTRPAAIEALKELDPGQRALLDLSLNRKLSDSLIAGLLENTDESGVAGMRTEALAAVARAAAIEGPGAAGEVERQLRSASDQQWLGVGETNGVHRNGHANGNGNGNGAVTTAPRPAPVAAAPPRRPRPQRSESTQPDRSRRLWAIAFALLAIAGVVAIVIALSGNDDGSSSTSPAATQAPTPAATPSQTAPAPAPPVQLEALTPGAVAGAATIAPAANGDGYVLRLQGLPAPDGYYRLWLYDSLIDSVPLGGIATGSGTVRFELPAGAANFGSLDLSIEDNAADTTHSGRSIFRIPLSDID